MATPKAGPDAGNGPAVLVCGSLRFSKERIENTRNGKTLIAFSREGVRWIRVGRDSPAEQPLSEFLCAMGAGVGGFFLLRGYTPGHAERLAAGIALCLLALWLVVHMAWRVPTLTIQRRDGTVNFRIRGKLSADDMGKLARKLRDELDWPVKD